VPDPSTSSRPGQRFRTQNIEWQARLQGVELASFRSRALAFAVDSLLISAVLVASRFWAGTASMLSDQSVVLNLEFGGLLSVGVAVLYFGLATYLGKGAHHRKAALRYSRRVTRPRPSLAPALL
jgi:hypothetical protein